MIDISVSQVGVNGAPGFVNLFAGAPEKWSSEDVELIYSKMEVLNSEKTIKKIYSSYILIECTSKFQ